MVPSTWSGLQLYCSARSRGNGSGRGRVDGRGDGCGRSHYVKKLLIKYILSSHRIPYKKKKTIHEF